MTRQECRFVDIAQGVRATVRETGPRDGAPVVYLHGVPGANVELARHGQLLDELGVWLLSIERPGYGESDPFERGHVAEWAQDFILIADAFGIDRFRMVGYCGGGAFALAAAARFPNRIERVALMGCPAPIDSDDVLEGMAPWVRLFWTLARSGAEALTEALEPAANDPAALAEAVLENMALEDRRLLDAPGARDQFVRVLVDAFRQGVGATVAELVQLAAPWSVDFSAITAPVDIWHGQCDTQVPVHHAQRLAACLPTASVSLVPGAGHYLIYDPAVVRKVLERLCGD